MCCKDKKPFGANKSVKDSTIYVTKELMQWKRRLNGIISELMVPYIIYPSVCM